MNSHETRQTALGANVSIGIHEDDFIELKKKRSSITGVGSAKAEGIGTIHWKLRTDSGKYIDVRVYTLNSVSQKRTFVVRNSDWLRAQLKANSPSTLYVGGRPDLRQEGVSQVSAQGKTERVVK